MANTQRSYEYVNDFLYFVMRPAARDEKEGLVYCSGVNISRFSAITKGRHGIGNPAVRALQNVNHGVRALALSKGAMPRKLRGNDCAGIASQKDTWYTELLLIEGASESFPGEMIDYCVRDLLTRIFRACLLDLQLPAELLKPDELQVFLDSLCVKYGGLTAPGIQGNKIKSD